MELSKKERLFLMNQYRILQKIDPENAESYANNYKAIEYGFTYDYDVLFEHMSEEMSQENCMEVIKILNMYRDITYSYCSIHKTRTVEDGIYKFKGFDANNESKQYSYCCYYLIDLGRFQELSYGEKIPYLNTHCPMLNEYRRMLIIWDELTGKSGRYGVLTMNQIDKLLGVHDVA